MKNYDEMIARIMAEKEKKEAQRASDEQNARAALAEINSMNADSRKELMPVVKRLEMFINGEKYTRAKKD